MSRGVVRRLSRGQRRLLVTAIYLGLVIYIGIFLGAENRWWLFVGILGLLTTIGVYSSLLAPFTQRIADKQESQLDERQLAIRNHAHRLAYQILGLLVVFVLLYAQINLTYSDNQLWASSIAIHDIPHISLSIIWLLITLPTSIIAWNEPDLEPEEMD